MNENLIEQILSSIRCLDGKYSDDFVAGYRRVILKSCDILAISPHYTVEDICNRINAFTCGLFRNHTALDHYISGAISACKDVTTFLTENKDDIETVDITKIEQTF